jgi:hypothetical protein
VPAPFSAEDIARFCGVSACRAGESGACPRLAVVIPRLRNTAQRKTNLKPNFDLVTVAEVPRS